MITHATPSVDGFNLFQERLVEFAEFIVTDLQPAAIRHRWVGLPETVRQKYAAEELQLLHEKQQQQQVPIQNVPTPPPAHQLYPSTRTMMRYPRTAPTMVAPVRAAIPHPQRNVRGTYVYKDESSQPPSRRSHGGGHQQFQHQLQHHQEVYYGQPQLQNEDELVQMIARQNQLHQQRSAQMTVPRQMIRQHPNFHFTNPN
ncbi:unnamed protein product [Caenorhabditis brenneri]